MIFSPLQHRRRQLSHQGTVITVTVLNWQGRRCIRCLGAFCALSLIQLSARLLRDGWRKLHGGNHDKFEHDTRPGVLLIVPRHREVSPGVARDIAKKAGWIR